MTFEARYEWALAVIGNSMKYQFSIGLIATKSSQVLSDFYQSLKTLLFFS